MAMNENTTGGLALRKYSTERRDFYKSVYVCIFDVIYHLCVFDLGLDLLIWGLIP